jgi:hypothetical protein
MAPGLTSSVVLEPSPQRLAQRAGRHVKVMSGDCLVRLGDQPLEAVRVQLIRLHLQQISGRLGQQALRGPLRGPATT